MCYSSFFLKEENYLIYFNMVSIHVLINTALSFKGAHPTYLEG